MTNFELNYEGFERNLVEKSKYPFGDGIHYVFRFDNEYGASVIKHVNSIGYTLDLWKLAMIKYGITGEWRLYYDTEITNDVIGCLTDERV